MNGAKSKFFGGMKKHFRYFTIFNFNISIKRRKKICMLLKYLFTWVIILYFAVNEEKNGNFSIFHYFIFVA